MMQKRDRDERRGERRRDRDGEEGGEDAVVVAAEATEEAN
jgi:hypothetical protein